MRLFEPGRFNDGLRVLVFLKAALLIAFGLELGYRKPGRGAGLTFRAARGVNVIAATAKAVLDQARIEGVVEFEGRMHECRAGNPVVQITARMLFGKKQWNRGRQFCHACVEGFAEQ